MSTLLWRITKKTIKILSIVFIVLLITACFLQDKIIYMPRKYGEEHVAKWQKNAFDYSPYISDEKRLHALHAKALHFETTSGKQFAYMLIPSNGKPKRLWVLCGGNGSLALDWDGWIRTFAPTDDAYLFVEYPGYGDCVGKPNPKGIRENIRSSYTLACDELQWKTAEAKAHTRFFGYSLGCAASLIAAEEFDLHRGILCAPFTSTMDMAKVFSGLPLGPLVTHRFDNKKIISDITKQNDSLLYIFHSTDDTVIPYFMSCELYRVSPEKIKHYTLYQAGHGSILDSARVDIQKAMADLE